MKARYIFQILQVSPAPEYKCSHIFNNAQTTWIRASFEVPLNYFGGTVWCGFTFNKHKLSTYVPPLLSSWARWETQLMPCLQHRPELTVSQDSPSALLLSISPACSAPGTQTSRVSIFPGIYGRWREKDRLTLLLMLQLIPSSSFLPSFHMVFHKRYSFLSFLSWALTLSSWTLYTVFPLIHTSILTSLQEPMHKTGPSFSVTRKCLRQPSHTTIFPQEWLSWCSESHNPRWIPLGSPARYDGQKNWEPWHQAPQNQNQSLNHSIQFPDKCTSPPSHWTQHLPQPPPADLE